MLRFFLTLTLTLILISPLFLLTSCVEGEEEIWINPDASGRLTLRYELPRMAKYSLGSVDAVFDLLREADRRDETIEIHRLHLDTTDQVIFELEASFTDARELGQLALRHQALFLESDDLNFASPEQVQAASGTTTFTLDGLTPTLHRLIPIGEALPDLVRQTPILLGSSQLQYTIHLPAKVKETNAHQISADQRSLTWIFLLQDHLNKPIEMTLSTHLPIPWWAWLVLVGALILAVLFVRRIIR